MEFIIAVVLILLNIPVYKVLYKLIFKDYDDFKESIHYSFIPNIVSLFRGEYCRDRIAEFKLSLLIAGCVIIVIGEFFLVRGIIGAFLPNF